MTNQEAASKIRDAARKYGSFYTSVDQAIIKQDVRDLNEVALWFERDEVERAVRCGQMLDTLVRDTIPQDVWDQFFSGR